MLISFAMICSCQKQDSAAEQQLAQRKVELNAREKALDEKEKASDEREKALNERERALAENERSAANARAIPPDVESRSATRDPAQLEAERDRRIQQLPPEFRALIPNPSQLNSAKREKDRRTQERLSQGQGGSEELQSQRQPKLKMSGGAVFPAPEATSPTPSSAAEATSPTPSPMPQ